MNDPGITARESRVLRALGALASSLLVLHGFDLRRENPGFL
ncbi:MAG TPA: hypothetical protein VF814_11235 [Casimicrobiaceae bacterium]